MPSLSRLAIASLAATATFLLTHHDADACGGFFARGPAIELPALEVEQTLIVHDPVKQVEHFIREVAFRKGNKTFGFVVPTPSRPEVAKVDDAPFRRLEKEYPFRAPHDGFGGLGGFGSGGSGAGAPRGVEVLSKQKLGSFTAFVLAATDAGGLKQWLTQNQFETTPASAAWLEHYVKVHFYFVAFRFDPPEKGEKTDAGAGEAPPVSSETMRISFSTPLPYYPYLEPDHPAKDAKDAKDASRVLDVWLVAPTPSTPVAAVQNANGTFRWKEPWLEGGSTTSDLPTLRTALGPSLASLLPAPQKPAQGEEPSLSVQVFEDQKKDRHGWGDVVMVPTEPVKLTDAELAKRRVFFDVLDPSRGGK